MLRLTPFTLLVALVLACSGDDKPSASQTASPTLEVAPATEPSPAPAPTAQDAIVSLGPPESLETSPLVALPVPEVPPVFFDTQSGERLETGSREYVAAYEAFVAPVGPTAENNLAIRAPDAGWLQVDLLFNRYVRGPAHLPIAAAALNTHIRILDLDSLTARDLSFLATPIAFSSDGTRLLVRDGLVREGASSFVVIPLDDPASTARLPLGSTTDPDLQSSAHWLSGSRLLVTIQGTPALQIIETAGAAPALIAEQLISSDQLSVSPDGSHFAVQRGNALEDRAVEIYDADTLQLIQTLEGASLGQHFEVPSEIWFPDAQRILVIRDMCRDDERLVSVDIQTLEETELARGGFLFWVVSPDAQWVAYTAWPREAWVVPADASSAAVPVSDQVTAVSRPYWSPDSRYASFHPFFGGYDRCLGLTAAS